MRKGMQAALVFAMVIFGPTSVQFKSEINGAIL